MDATSSCPPSSPARIRRTLGWSVLDGVLHAAMLGVSESYLGVFAVELGHGDAALAILVTLPPLIGAIAQLLAPMLAIRLGSRKRLVVLGAALQALSHLGFVWIALENSPSLTALLLVKVAFWVSGMIIVPPWNAWMATLTESVARARYFMWRSTACHLALLLSFLWSGQFLQAGRAASIHHAFAVLFGLGLLARGLAAAVVSLQADPDRPLHGVSLSARLREALALGPWKLALAIGLLQFGAHVSVPFFTPYMLRTLDLQLNTFALLTAISIVGRAVSLPLWGMLSKRAGLTVAMTAGVVGIAVVPAAWVLSHDFQDLVLVHVFSGMAWAGFEYASFQLLLGSAPKHSAVEFFSLSGTLSGSLQLAGSMLGTLLLRSGFDYHGVFLVSSVLRLVPAALLAPLAATMARRIPLRKLLLRISSVRSSGGVERRLVVIDMVNELSAAPPEEDLGTKQDSALQ